MNRIRVLHVFGAMDFGGAEIRTIELLPAMLAEGVEFHFVTLSGRRGELAERIERAGGYVWPLRLTPAFPIRFLRLARRLKLNAIDSHVATFSGALVALAWLARIPVRIAHFRSDDDGRGASWSRRLQRKVMKLLIRLFSTDIVGVSPSALTHGYDPLWERDPRAKVIVNGFASYQAIEQPPSGLDLGPHVKLLTLVARPSPEKNRIKAIDILHELLACGEPVKLVLVGGRGADSDAVEDRIVTYGIEEAVIDLGKRADAVQVMAASDVVLLTSHREGLPGVVLEAVSTGAEVVSVDLPGVKFMTERVDGITLVDADAPAEMWVAPICAALARSKDAERRAAQVRSFEGSPFSLSSSIYAHRRLYRVAR